MVQWTWKEKHKEVIEQVLQFINARSDDYVLKGETSLMECYGLKQFSEDIDLNSTNREKIFEIMNSFEKQTGYKVNLKKDTPTTVRFMIDYGGNDGVGNVKPLKVEISYREKYIEREFTAKINGIRVYDIDSIASMKALAYGQRDKIRDLYDITFIVNNYWKQLDKRTQAIIRDSVSRKGIEQFDYIVATQKDDLIDESELSEQFLEMLEIIGATNEKDEPTIDDEEKSQEIHQEVQEDHKTKENSLDFDKEHRFSDLKAVIKTAKSITDNNEKPPLNNKLVSRNDIPSL